MTTQYAARHVALGGDDSEPDGLASAWGDGPAPRRAMMPEEALTSYEPYAPLSSQTPRWHIAVEPSSPLAPGPVHAATPVTVGPLTDPASLPTPMSNFAAVSYQSMPSPMPYASAPGQGPYVAPMASPAPYGAVPQPYAASTPVSDEVEAAGVTVVASIQRKVFGLVIVGISLAPITTVGALIGGNVWWTVGFAWAVGIIMIVGILMPGRMRLRQSALK
jgi:hypothetical protein